MAAPPLLSVHTLYLLLVLISCHFSGAACITLTFLSMNIGIWMLLHGSLSSPVKSEELLQNPYYEQIKRKQSSGCRESRAGIRLKNEIIGEI